jgi:hypothetical protein
MTWREVRRELVTAKHSGGVAQNQAPELRVREYRRHGRLDLTAGCIECQVKELNLNLQATAAQEAVYHKGQDGFGV